MFTFLVTCVGCLTGGVYFNCNNKNNWYKQIVASHESLSCPPQSTQTDPHQLQTPVILLQGIPAGGTQTHEVTPLDSGH